MVRNDQTNHKTVVDRLVVLPPTIPLLCIHARRALWRCQQKSGNIAHIGFRRGVRTLEREKMVYEFSRRPSPQETRLERLGLLVLLLESRLDSRHVDVHARTHGRRD